ncbi:hypothetical protein [Haloarcula amylovorans]|uniref:hypothetical protein n=1 Tax=Haloarcula amylovorans TaxID=2562280 RepID=UPI00142F7DE6|nr:hypothetical protein [Halomicroarcula amylolytica]
MVLTPSDAIPKAFGRAVAIDGDTAIVGADEVADGFERSDGDWSLSTRLTAGPKDQKFGRRSTSP